MVQQYFSLDEAAQALGISKEELNRIREQGDIRAFADRGTWKFRKQDVEEAARQRGVGSDPQMPMLDEPDFSSDEEQILVSEQEVGPSDSSVSSTVLGMGDSGASSSDSDIRLVPDLPGSDSDVKLVADLNENKPGSDSDVKVVDAQSLEEDSDVRVEESEPSLVSDSDVTLASDSSSVSDSDVRIEPVGSGSSDELAIPGEGDSDFELSAEESSSESDITIAPTDSGISLSQPADSGISLEQPDDLSLGSDIAAAQTDETEFEIPTAAAGAPQGSSDATAAELEMESDFELAPLEAESESSSEIVSLDDEPEVDESAATSSGTTSAVFDDVGASSVDMGGAVDVEDDIETLTGPAPGRPADPVISRTSEQEWGTLPFAGLCVSTVLLALTGIMMLDLVRNVWSWGQPNPVSGGLVGLLKGLLF